MKHNFVRPKQTVCDRIFDIRPGIFLPISRLWDLQLTKLQCCKRKAKAMFYGIKTQMSVFKISTENRVCTLAYTRLCM